MNVIMPFVSFSVIDFVSEIIGRIFYISKNWRIKAIQENLEAIGAKNFRTERVFENMIKNHFELLKLHRMSKTKLIEITEGYDHNEFEKYRRNNFILTGHCGNWDIAPIFISAIKMKSCTIAEYKNVGERMYEILKIFRGKHGMIVFPLEDVSTPIKLRDSYRAGYTQFLLIDRDITRIGIPVKVGNKILKIPKGPFYFANKFSSNIAIGTFIRNKSKRYRFKITIRDLGKIDNMESGAQKAIDSLFDLIRTNPEQWFAFDLNWEK